MASNDYYYGSQKPPAHDSPSPAPYYSSAYPPSPHTGPAPSYHSDYPATAPSHPYGQRQQQTGPSPFDTVFDDNAYPMNSRNPTPTASTAHVGQPSPYYDASYQGAGGARPYPEDIPLQDRPKEPEINDHIYDAAGQPPQQKSRKVRFGELGMFGADKKRIPWVVYTLTLVQVAVFIAEIVRNGKTAESWWLSREANRRTRYPYGITHHDQAAVQPHDWSLNTSHDQHGGPLLSMHA